MNKEDVTSAAVSDDDFSYYSNDEAQSGQTEAATAEPPAYESATISRRLEQALRQANGKSISIDVETQADRNALELYAAACLGDIETAERMIALGADISYGGDVAIKGALMNKEVAFAEAYCDDSKLFNILYKLKPSTGRNNYLKEMILTRRHVLSKDRKNRKKRRENHKVFDRIGVATFSDDEFDTLYEIYGNYIFMKSKTKYTYIKYINHERMLSLLEDGQCKVVKYVTGNAEWLSRYESDREMVEIIILHPRMSTRVLGAPSVVEFLKNFEDLIYHSKEVIVRLEQADKITLDTRLEQADKNSFDPGVSMLQSDKTYFNNLDHFTKLSQKGYYELLNANLDRFCISKEYHASVDRRTLGITRKYVEYIFIDNVLKSNADVSHNFGSLLQNKRLCIYLFKEWQNVVRSFNPQETLATCARHNYLDGIKKCLKWNKDVYTVDDLTYSLDLSTDKKCRKKLQKAIKKLAKENKKRRK